MNMEHDAEWEQKSKGLFHLFILLVTGTLVGLIVSFGSLRFIYNRIENKEAIQSVWRAFSTNFTLESIFICINIFLLLGLLWSYRTDFKKTKSPFLMGLIVFFIVLLGQSILSFPMFNLIVSVLTIDAQVGFRYILLTYTSAVFTIIAHFFETIALIILFHLSNE